MECVALHSRLIASAAYYRPSGTLRVWFHNNRCAVHDGVSEAMFRNLVEAESPGFYYRQYIADRDVHHSTGLRPGVKLALSLAASLFMLIASGGGLTTGSEGAVPVDGRTACGSRCSGLPNRMTGLQSQTMRTTSEGDASNDADERFSAIR